MEDLGTFLRSTRLRHGWTLQQVEEKSGVDWQYIGKIERGGVNKPGDRFLLPIAEALGISYEELRMHQGWVIGSGYRTAEEEGVTRRQPRVRRLDADREGVETVPVLPEWLDGREPSQCFVLKADDDLPDGGILKGYLVLFERLSGTVPAVGDVVAAKINEHDWWMFVWDGQTDIEPIGRKLRAWG